MPTATRHHRRGAPPTRSTTDAEHYRRGTLPTRSTTDAEHHRRGAPPLRDRGTALPTALVSGQCGGGGASAAGLRRSAIAGDNPFLVHVMVPWFRLMWTWKNQRRRSTRRSRLRIQNIVWRLTQLLAHIYIYYIYSMILFRFRAPGLPPEPPECSRVFTEHGQSTFSNNRQLQKCICA